MDQSDNHVIPACMVGYRDKLQCICTGRLTVLDRSLPNTVTILDRFRCILKGVYMASPARCNEML